MPLGLRLWSEGRIGILMGKEGGEGRSRLRIGSQRRRCRFLELGIPVSLERVNGSGGDAVSLPLRLRG